MKIFYLLTTFLIVFSCAGYKPVRIESNPSEAQVFVYDDDQKKFISMGQTPFLLEKEKLSKVNKENNDFLAFRIERAGFVVEHLIYDLKTKKKMTYLLQLKPLELWSDKSGETSSKLANDIAKKVQKLNRHILTKDLDKAMELTTSLIEQYPKAYVFYDIKGSIHILKGNKKEAVVSLKKSLAINPDNLESENILKVLAKEGVQ